MIFIYALSGPDSIIRYVGKTNDLVKRLSSHKHPKKTHITPCTNWCRFLAKNGLSPVMEIIDEVESDEWEFWEKFYISLYRPLLPPVGIGHDPVDDGSGRQIWYEQTKNSHLFKRENGVLHYKMGKHLAGALLDGIEHKEFPLY